MPKHCARKLPESLLTRRVQIDFIVDFWNQWRIDGDTGSTSWEVLENLERQVTDCLASDPPDLDRADSLTAQAMLLMSGQLRL